jgi:hypothetical protein
MTKPTQPAAAVEVSTAAAQQEQTQELNITPAHNDDTGQGMIEFLMKAQSLANALDTFTEAVRLNVSYMELKNIGEEVRGVFMGYGKATMKDPMQGGFKELKTVILMTAEGVKIHAGVNLLNTFEGANLQPGAPVQVKFERSDKIDGGKTVKVYGVHLLKAL